MKKTIFSCILFLLLYACFECASALGLFYLARFRNMHYMPADRLSAEQIATIESFINTSSSYFEFDREAGWTIQANGRYRDIYRANSAGIRADREYDVDIPEGTVRISTFGDSFTHCDDVANHETWQAFIESRRPDFEVLNFGVGAYGLDQAYVRYSNKGRTYKVDFVLIGFMPENIFRMVNTFRAFYQPATSLPLSKPRFILDEEDVALLPNPLESLSDYQALLNNSRAQIRQMGSYDYFYHQRYTSGPFDWSPGMRLLKMIAEKTALRFSVNSPIRNGVFNVRSEAFVITVKVFDLFYRACQEDAIPVILIFPHRGTMKQIARGGRCEYAPLLDYFQKMGYRYIDLMEAFEGEAGRDSLDALFVGEHYSPKANSLVAGHLLSYVESFMMQGAGAGGQ
jgi:hypothetical protein